MNVLNNFIENSSLNGMPNWYKVTTLVIFSVIVISLLAMLALVFTVGTEVNINF